MLRKEFLSADIGITGCNFAIAESGSISLVTNEGNARLTTALPKTQITVMGMERIVPTFEEFEVLVSLLTRSAVGQRLTSYVTALTGPRLPGEVDGPEEFHLVIVDNGRSAILGTEFQSVLQCIRCAACVNVCPVYRHIGGHSYGSIYSGPIGAVLSPLLGGYEDYKELPYASTLCAACTDACPVKIPLHELLHKHRQRIVEKEGKAPISEKLAMKAFGLGAASSSLYTVGAKVAPAALTPFMSGSSISKGPGPLKAWTESREFPAPTKERLRDWFDKRSDDDERKHSK
jgi:L-lactate dehydrogenase complex protein LldF